MVDSLFNKFIKEVERMKTEKNLTLQDGIQKELFLRIQKKLGHPLMAYFANFENEDSMINFKDKTYFCSLIDSIPDDKKELYVILFSPGGYADAVERIVELLRQRFDLIHFIIPNAAKSAATMMALSGNEIIMKASAELGPIDPQVQGGPFRTSAQAIIDGFNEIKDIVDREGHLNGAYIPILSNMDISLMKNCRINIEYGKELAKKYLIKYMLAEKEDKENIAQHIVDYLSDYTIHKTHGKAIYREELQREQLPITDLSSLKDNVARDIWEYHYRFEFIIQNNTQVSKIYQTETEYMVTQYGRLSLVPMQQPPAEEKK